jgi:hypothetical protein
MPNVGQAADRRNAHTESASEPPALASPARIGNAHAGTRFNAPPTVGRGGALTGESRSEARTPPEAEGKSRGANAKRSGAALCGGPSGARLAGALTRDVWPMLAGGDLRTHSFTFTAGGPAEGTRDVMLWAVPLLLAAFEALAGQGAGLLLALDLHAPGERYHLHALAVAPVRFAPRDLLRAWVALSWPEGRAPARWAQYVRRVESCRSVLAVLAHHLGPKARHPAAAAELPATWGRVWAVGALAGPWQRAAALLRLPGAPSAPVSPGEPASVRKGPTLPSRPRVRPGCCGWCGRPLVGMRSDARWHPECGRSASRARVAAVARWGPEVRGIVARLERRGWLRVHALAVACAAARLGLGPDDPLPRYVLKRWACPCGLPLALRRNAKGCGSSTCRQARLRVRAERGL